MSHDVFAETNPAYCAYVLAGFAEAFTAVKDFGPDMPLAYLSLPVALSGDLNNCFEGTNKKTGLLEWLERSPQIQIGLPGRLNGSMGIVTEAIRFGCFSGVLAVGIDARLNLGNHKVKKTIGKTLSKELSLAFKHAERLGYWFAAAGSTRTVFDIMGLTV